MTGDPPAGSAHPAAPDPAAEIAAAFREGLGPPPPGASVEVTVTARAPILYRVRARLSFPGGGERRLDVDVPLEGRRQFARALGGSLRGRAPDAGEAGRG